MRKCTNQRCKFCPHMRITKTIYNRKCQTNFVIPKYKKTLTCEDRRVIYAIKCGQCNETYIGQTSRPLKARIAEHLYDIQNKTNTHMSHHFNKTHKIDKFNFLPLEKIDDKWPAQQTEAILKDLEKKWIRRLSTLQPYGMNYIPTDTTIRTIPTNNPPNSSPPPPPPLDPAGRITDHF